MVLLFDHPFLGNVKGNSYLILHKYSIQRELSIALRILTEFSSKYGWETNIKDCHLEGIEIFRQQKSLLLRIKELDKSSNFTSSIDYSGLSAAVIGNILVVLTPNSYRHIRPEYCQIDHCWSRLIVHELIHLLHISLLNGDESKMGPKWFYEGFALFGAGYRLGNSKYGTAKEVIENTKIMSRTSYSRYLLAFEFFVSKIELNKLIEMAYSDNFENWLIQSF